MNQRKRFSIKYGSEIAFQSEDESGFVSSRGGSTSAKLIFRRGTNVSDLFSFENCVFAVVPPPARTQQHNASSEKGGKPPSSTPAADDAFSVASMSYASLGAEVTYGAKFFLRHKQSGLFLSLLSSQPSELDPECHAVCLITPREAATARSALFRFAPRFKVHNEGDYVCVGDQLLLQVVSSKLYLHLSEIGAPVTQAAPSSDNTPVLPSSAEAVTPQRPNSSAQQSVQMSPPQRSRSPLQTKSFSTPPTLAAIELTEVNGSESGSSWMVLRYDQGVESADYNKVLSRGKPPVAFGVPVALFHRERESLLISSIAKPQEEPSSGKQNSKSSRSTSGLERRRGYQSMYFTREASSLSHRSAIGSAQSTSSDLAAGGGGAAFPLLSPYLDYMSNDFSFSTLKCSCTAYWVFEHADPRIGGPLRYGEPFRLRQAATNMYLSIGGSGLEEFLGNSSFAPNNHASSSAFSFAQTATSFFSSNNSSPPVSGALLSGRRGTGGSNGSNSGNITLSLIPAPQTEDALRRSLFTIHHMFTHEATIVAETDYFRIQNIETGLWVCTDTDSGMYSETLLVLDGKPSLHDAWMTGHVLPAAHKDVMYIFYNYDALRRYRNVFAAWAQLRRRQLASASAAALDPSQIRAPTFTTKAHRECIQQCTEALTHLIYFCTASDDLDPFEREGLPLLYHQKMMFDLQIHHIVFEVIVAPLVDIHDEPTTATMIDLGREYRLPPIPLEGGAVPRGRFDVKDSEYSALHNISRLGLRLVKQMVLGSPTLATLVSRYIPVMFDLDGMKLHVVETMHEIFTENAHLPMPMITKAIDHYVRTLVKRQRSAGYLKFLATMCAEGDENGIVENQELVCRKLILEVPDENAVFLRTVLLESGHVGVQYSSSDPPMAIQKFLTQHTDGKLVKFFEGQIELFWKLSCGFSSRLCLSTLESIFPSVQLNGIINTILWTGEEVAGRASRLDGTRSNLFNLAMNLYVHPTLNNPEVQIALNTVLIGSSNIRDKWKEAYTKPHVSHSGVRDSTLMASLKAAAMQLLRANPYFVISDRSRNELLRTVVELWCVFVSYRQFTTEEVQQVIPLVVNLLDGKKDVATAADIASPHHSATHSSSQQHNASTHDSTSKGQHSGHTKRFEKNEDSFVVMRARRSVCKLLGLILAALVHETSDEIIVYLFEALSGQTPSPSSGGSNAAATISPSDSHSRQGVLMRVGTSIRNVLRRDSKATDDGSMTKLTALRRNKDTRKQSKVNLKQLVGTTSHAFDVSEFESHLQEKCFSTESVFLPQRLVPMLLDVSRYNDRELTTAAMDLLVRLCSVKRNVCRAVLSVRSVPTRDMIAHFDRLHLVAVELLAAVKAGDIDEFADAMEIVLSTLLQNYVPKFTAIGAEDYELAGSPTSEGNAPEGEMINVESQVFGESSPKSARRQRVKFAEQPSDDESPDGSSKHIEKLITAPAQAKPPKSAKSHWAQATTIARMVAMGKRIKKKRNSLGLDASNDVPLDVICRAELMCHWGLHHSLLLFLESGTINTNHHAYVDVMNFFYYFSLSPSNARELAPSLQLFVDAIQQEDVHVQCMHIVVAVLSSKGATTTQRATQGSAAGGTQNASMLQGDASKELLDFKLLDSLTTMMVKEVEKENPDCSFLRLVNKSLFGKESSPLSHVSSRQILHLLHTKQLFAKVADPKSTIMRASELAFNSALVELLAGLCRCNRSLRTMIQRILPSASILSILTRTPSSNADKASGPLPLLHQVPYLHVLQTVHFQRDEDSLTEERRVVQQWMQNLTWWKLVGMFARQYSEACNLLRTPSSNMEAIEATIVDHREYWFEALPNALAILFGECFDSHAGGIASSALVAATKEFCSSFCDLAALLPSVAETISITLEECLVVQKLLGVFVSVCQNIDGMYSLTERLSAVRQYQMNDTIEKLRRSEEGAFEDGSGSKIAKKGRLRSNSLVGPGGASGSFTLQSSRRDMSVHEAAAKRVLLSFVPADKVLSPVLFASSATAQYTVKILATVGINKRLLAIMFEPQGTHDGLDDGASGLSAECAENGTPAPSRSIGGQLKRSEVDAFIVKVLEQLCAFAFSTETISGLLNIFHRVLTLSPSASNFPLINDSNPNLPTATSKHERIAQQLSSTEEQTVLVERQIHFDKLGLMRVVLGVADLVDRTVTKAALDVGIALLEGGNTAVQNAMLQYFDTHDETFFHNVKEILQSCLHRVHARNEWIRKLSLTTSAGSNSSPNNSSPGDVSPAPEREEGGHSDEAVGDEPPAELLRSASFLLQQSPASIGGQFDHHSTFLFISELFRLLQLMCEGHHLGMQNYIRVQSDNLHSINIVQEVLQLIHELCAVRIDAANKEVICRGIALLTEFCQGPCVENQSTLLSNDVCRLIAYIFGLQEDDSGDAPGATDGEDDGADLICEVQRDASVLLLSLIEGCSKPDVYHKILYQIPLPTVEKLVAVLSKSTSTKVSGEELEEEADESTGSPDGTPGSFPSDSCDGDDDDDDDPSVNLLFNLLIFAKSVTPFLESISNHKSLSIVRRMFDHSSHIASRLGSIQVERDGVVERVFFPIPELCLSLTHQSKDQLLWSVDRTSRTTKLSDFFHKIDEVLFEIDATYRYKQCVLRMTQFSVTKCSRLKSVWNESIAPWIFNSNGEYYETIALFVAAVINVLFVFTDGIDKDETTTSVMESLITFLCGVQAVLYSIVLGTDCVVFLPVFFYRTYKKHLRSLSGSQTHAVTSQEDISAHFSWRDKLHMSLLGRLTTSYYLGMILASILAVFWSPYFAAAHLSGLIYRSSMLRTVIVAITQNGKSLLLTMGLGVIIVYMFSIIGYTYFPDAFTDPEKLSASPAVEDRVTVVGETAMNLAVSSSIADSDDNCKTLGRCFMFILTQGLRQGGGVGDLMQAESWLSVNLGRRMGYDFAFYALVNVVFLNILFGIIIDTFAELRDDKRRKEEDMNTCCFICGLDADVFDKEGGGGFRRHVAREHNMWQYLYFIYHLRIKDPNDFTGQESYVSREIQAGSLSFFPDGQCLTLIQSNEKRAAIRAASTGGAIEDREDRASGTAAQATTGASGNGGSVGFGAGSAKEIEGLRDQITSALQAVTLEVSTLRSAQTVASGVSGVVPTAAVQPSATTGSTLASHIAASQQLRDGEAVPLSSAQSAAGFTSAGMDTLKAAAARRRSRTTMDFPPPPPERSTVSNFSFDTSVSSSFAADTDTIITTLHAEIARLSSEQLEELQNVKREIQSKAEEAAAARNEQEILKQCLYDLLHAMDHNGVLTQRMSSGESSPTLLPSSPASFCSYSLNDTVALARSVSMLLKQDSDPLVSFLSNVPSATQQAYSGFVAFEDIPMETSTLAPHGRTQLVSFSRSTKKDPPLQSDGADCFSPVELSGNPSMDDVAEHESLYPNSRRDLLARTVSHMSTMTDNTGACSGATSDSSPTASQQHLRAPLFYTDSPSFSRQVSFAKALAVSSCATQTSVPHSGTMMMPITTGEEKPVNTDSLLSSTLKMGVETSSVGCQVFDVEKEMLVDEILRLRSELQRVGCDAQKYLSDCRSYAKHVNRILDERNHLSIELQSTLERLDAAQRKLDVDVPIIIQELLDGLFRYLDEVHGLKFSNDPADISNPASMIAAPYFAKTKPSSGSRSECSPRLSGSPRNIYAAASAAQPLPSTELDPRSTALIAKYASQTTHGTPRHGFSPQR